MVKNDFWLGTILWSADIILQPPLQMGNMRIVFQAVETENCLVHRLKEVGEGWLIIAWEAVGLVVRDMEGESAGANSVGPWRS